MYHYNSQIHDLDFIFRRSNFSANFWLHENYTVASILEQTNVMLDLLFSKRG